MPEKAVPFSKSGALRAPVLRAEGGLFWMSAPVRGATGPEGSKAPPASQEEKRRFFIFHESRLQER